MERRAGPSPGTWGTAGARRQSLTAPGLSARSSGEDLVHPGNVGFESLAGGLVFLLLGAENHLVADEFDPGGEGGPGGREAEKGGAKSADPRRRRGLLEPQPVALSAGLSVLGNDGRVGTEANVGGGDGIAGSSEFLAVDDLASDTNLLKAAFSPE